MYDYTKNERYEIINILEIVFNYDIANIILNKLSFMNHKIKFNNSINKLNNLNEKYLNTRQTNVYPIFLLEPLNINQYILMKNRVDLKSRYKYIKKDYRYKLI